MKIAILSPVTWRTSPVNFAAFEQAASLLTKELISLGIDVTLFAPGCSTAKETKNSFSLSDCEEHPSTTLKMYESLHISELMDKAEKYDIIHNQFDFLPLTYSGNIPTPIITTIHGPLSGDILPVYRKYNKRTYYVSTSSFERHPDLSYIRTIYNCIDFNSFNLQTKPEDYLLFFGEIYKDGGAKESINIAKKSGKKLIISGTVRDKDYFNNEIKPYINDDVSFIDVVEQEKRNDLFGNAICLLHTVNSRKLSTLSVIESMACGTPVIAFDKGSVKEIIQHEKNGFLVSSINEAADTIHKVKTIDREYCRNYAKSRFTAKKMAENYIEVYSEILEKEKRESHRPWGFYKVLADEINHKAKRILVNPGKRLSLQRHQLRDEHWYIIEGEGTITIDDKVIVCRSGQSVNIPKKAAHRIENRGETDLVFIEVQTGNYFGEDDIERIEDDFGRS